MRESCLKIHLHIFLAFIFLSPNLNAWTITRDFNEGQSGTVTYENDNGFDGAAGQSLYNDERAYEGGQSAELTIDAELTKPDHEGGSGGFGRWGGIIEFPEVLAKGDEIWIQLYMLVPQNFIFDTPGNGSLKFIRVAKHDNIDSNTGYLDFQIIDEDDPGNYVFRELSESQAKWFYYGQRGVDDIKRWQWQRYEIYIKFDHIPEANGGQAKTRFWLNDKLLSENTEMHTLKNANDLASALYLFTYWNGQAPQTQSLWVDHITIQSDKPNLVDSQGNLFIGETLMTIRPKPPQISENSEN